MKPLTAVLVAAGAVFLLFAGGKAGGVFSFLSAVSVTLFLFFLYVTREVQIK